MINIYFNVNLPTDTRTLLKTPRNFFKKNIAPGVYYYFGLKNCIEKHISFLKNNKLQEILIDINVDGLPIAKSANSQFWPILGYIFFQNKKSECFLIGIYHGNSKPVSFNDFLSDFCNELINSRDKLSGKKNYNKTKVLFCDPPAKSSVLNIVSHNSFFGCNKCDVVGKHDGTSVVFPQINNKSFSDLDFRNKVNKAHHKGVTIIEKLNIDIVSQFPVDYMHCVLLGVTKKLITYWIKDKNKEHGLIKVF